ncbi:hypothetical protein R69927_07184 [Paraburkholderia domus]|uniref:serine hydrolase n=1 Tax=Paraburkholderia domus TaxID=2793075 RepID=UPI001913F893|nr:serine hydrolase [Paraburkholderia domus]MBK5091265.1 serine hydrolase [Burkholderia sp. R-69927]CAE6931598.1 hypothetical protein R69927_07184 [Paraburkholderia domus]
MFFQNSAKTDALGQQMVRYIVQQFGPIGLSDDSFSLTLLLHPLDSSRMFGAESALPVGYSYRGNAPFYPCSVVKMFILAAAQAAILYGRVVKTPALERAMHDMIKWSSNTATNYVIDILTDTTGDTELESSEMEAWVKARNGINVYLQSLGLLEFEDINICQKLMDDDRYGREKIFVRWGGNNHNRLTTHATASMMARIMEGDMVSPECSQQMANFLCRPRDSAFMQVSGAQVLGYLGEKLPADVRIWSKAGWTGWTRDPLASYRRHDAIHVSLPQGPRFTLAVFTEGQKASQDDTMLPLIGKQACELLAEAFPA